MKEQEFLVRYCDEGWRRGSFGSWFQVDGLCVELGWSTGCRLGVRETKMAVRVFGRFCLLQSEEDHEQ